MLGVSRRIAASCDAGRTVPGVSQPWAAVTLLLLLTSGQAGRVGESVDDEAVGELFAEEGEQFGRCARAVGQLELLQLSELGEPGQAARRHLRAACEGRRGTLVTNTRLSRVLCSKIFF